MRKRFIIVLVTFAFVCTACAVPLSRLNREDPTFNVKILIKPSNAKVFLDGYYVGKAKRYQCNPRCMQITKGAHVLTFKAKDYENETIEIQGSLDVKVIELTLKPVPK